jgi:hypothetical protein
MAGRTVSFALKARNHGSAMAVNCDDSFMSKKIYPVRSPLSSAKYAAYSGVAFAFNDAVAGENLRARRS